MKAIFKTTLKECKFNMGIWEMLENIWALSRALGNAPEAQGFDDDGRR